MLGPKLLIISFMLLPSCALVKTANTQEAGSTPAVYPTQAVLDLGRSAYLKGCTDALTGQQSNTRISNFEICKGLSQAYEQELKLILESRVSQ